MEYKSNITWSPYDNRDYIYQSSNIEYPEELDYRNDLQPIRDQGNQGSCFAQSVACVKEWQEKKDYNLNQYLSPQFFYDNRFNLYDDDKTNDFGMYGRDVMKLMKNIGICLEKSYPYGFITNKKNISEEIYKEAKNHIIKKYARIFNIKQLKESLYKNGPCIICFPIYNYSDEFWKGSKSIGGHAVTIVGYNKTGFIIRNSWSNKWANNGYSIYKYNDWGCHWEVWTTIDEKSKYIIYNNSPKNNCCSLL